MKYIKDLSTSYAQLKEFTPDFTLQNILERPRGNSTDVADRVSAIGKEVLERGDEALRELTKKLDKVDLENFRVTEEEFREAEALVDEAFKRAVSLARDNIQSFHERQKPVDLEPEETSKGVWCSRQFRPIEKIGLYIPGGTAPLFSTVLMLGVPAIIAGCQDISICTPPNTDGKVAPEILYSAKMLGIDKVYKIGGAQAVFAMAYGTKQVGKVDKIFGPGNSYVTQAKMNISNICAIDMPAGPSEVLVIADGNADASYVATDLLSQCEHGTDSQSVLITDSEKLISAVLEACRKQLENLPRRDVALKSLQNSFAILANDMDEAFRISNEYAPEHLILQMDGWKNYINRIINAGSVFCGAYSPESAGDYCSGTNHTLPTSGFAKSYSGIGLESFGKWITFQEITREGLQNIGKDIETMASSEGLYGHKNAVSIRL